MPFWDSTEKSRSLRVHLLQDWWESARGDAPMPDRSQFDPSAFAQLLRYLMISEVMVDPFRVRYRLLGTMVVDVCGLDFTGVILDELMPSGVAEEPWQEHYLRVYQTARPLYGICHMKARTGADFSYEFGIWPLTNGGKDVAQFVAIEDYGDISPRIVPRMEPIERWRRQK